MEGLHIFNQTEIMALPNGYFLIVFGLGIIFAIIGGVISDSFENKFVKFVGILIYSLSITIMVVMGAGWQMFQQPTGKYEYTVSIDDNKVNLLEFNDKYEIVKQDGELWIIKDK